jgi:predicted TPR repeat methyltransferase
LSTPLFLSSGDMRADRRYDLARQYLADGDLAAASDLFAQAVELAPRFASAWFALGEVRDRQGDRDGARTAFEKALATDPQDRHGAALQLARLGAADPATEALHSYVRTLFDQYAPRFDRALADLGYRAPALLRDTVEAECRAQGRAMRFRSMLDLGCGTGLAGGAFRPHVDQLIGVDLAPRMVEAARAKGLYDELTVGDIGAVLVGQSGASHDLAIAADVFGYIADFSAICDGVARVLAPGGLFGFTVETHDGPGAIVGAKMRYAHGEPFVRDAIARAGLTLRRLEPASTRNENRVPVPGLVVLAQR